MDQKGLETDQKCQDSSREPNSRSGNFVKMVSRRFLSETTCVLENVCFSAGKQGRYSLCSCTTSTPLCSQKMLTKTSFLSPHLYS